MNIFETLVLSEVPRMVFGECWTIYAYLHTFSELPRANNIALLRRGICLPFRVLEGSVNSLAWCVDFTPRCIIQCNAHTASYVERLAVVGLSYFSRIFPML